MAALTRPTEATYTCHEHVTVDTSDHQDHTFCGIMFPVEIQANLPIEKVTIQTLSVRGRLGPLTVWVSGVNIEQPNNSNENENENEEEEPLEVVEHYNRRWTKLYDAVHSPSVRRYVPLELTTPVTLSTGQQCFFYIHSTLHSDQAIVYDNARKRITYQDDILVINSGRAHLSSTPFGTVSLWGYPGAWRDARAFVGRLEYGILYKLWNPHIHQDFGDNFNRMVLTLLLCQRRDESPISMLPDEVLYYILNMCGITWAAGCRDCGKKGGKSSWWRSSSSSSSRSILAKKPKKEDTDEENNSNGRKSSRSRSFLGRLFGGGGKPSQNDD